MAYCRSAGLISVIAVAEARSPNLESAAAEIGRAGATLACSGALVRIHDMRHAEAAARQLFALHLNM